MSIWIRWCCKKIHTYIIYDAAHIHCFCAFETLVVMPSTVDAVPATSIIYIRHEDSECSFLGKYQV